MVSMKPMTVFAILAKELSANTSVKYTSLPQLHQQEVCMMEKRLIGLGVKLKKEKKERDMAAYKRLRSEGIQPKGIDGAAKMEREASTTHEIKAGTLLQGPKSEKKRKERALNDVLGSG